MGATICGEGKVGGEVTLIEKKLEYIVCGYLCHLWISESRQSINFNWKTSVSYK